MHGHKKVIHVKDSLKNNIWGTAGFTLPKLIHVLKESSANSALNQKETIDATSFKIRTCAYGSDFYCFSVCA